MPYFIKNKSPDKSLEDMIAEIDNIELSGDSERKGKLNHQVEQAYLEKEIERMYERLAKAGRDTAVVSDKLSELKKSQHNN